jgi:hypothetical protein
MTPPRRIYPVLRHRRSRKFYVGTIRGAILADHARSRGLLIAFGGARRLNHANVILVGIATQFGFRSYEVRWCEGSGQQCSHD